MYTPKSQTVYIKVEEQIYKMEALQLKGPIIKTSATEDNDIFLYASPLGDFYVYNPDIIHIIDEQDWRAAFRVYIAWLQENASNIIDNLLK